jgi:hypothetical protein
LQRGQEDHFQLVDSRYLGEEHADVRSWSLNADLERLEIRGCGRLSDVHIVETVASYSASGTFPVVHAMFSYGLVIVATRDEGGPPTSFSAYVRGAGYKAWFWVNADDVLVVRPTYAGAEILFDGFEKGRCANGKPLRSRLLYDNVTLVQIDEAC